MMKQINPVPNVPTPPETPTNPSVNFPSLNKFLIVFLVIFVIVLVSLNAYLFLKLQNQPKTPVGSPAPVVQTSPTPTPDPTADWTIYKNSDFNFSLKHPPAWIVFLGSKGNSGLPKNIINFQDSTTGFIQFQIIVNNIDTQLPIKAATERYILNNTNVQNAQEISSKNLTIAGKEAVESSYIIDLHTKVTFYGIKNNGKNFYIVVQTGSDKRGIQQDTFDQILSTFKFLE